MPQSSLQRFALVDEYGDDRPKDRGARVPVTDVAPDERPKSANDYVVESEDGRQNDYADERPMGQPDSTRTRTCARKRDERSDARL